MKRFISISLVCALTALPLAAAVLFDNGGPNAEAGGVASNFAGHDPEYEFQSADDFQLTTTSTITHVVWWGVYQSSNIPLKPDLFTIRIFADEQGTPASEALAEWYPERVKRNATGVESSGFDIYEYDAGLKSPITLPAGTYWLSIVNDVRVEETNTDWLWQLHDSSNGNLVARFNDQAAWAPFNSFSAAFQIRGAAHHGSR